MSLISLSVCTGKHQRQQAEFDKLNRLIDSVTNTSMKSGRYTLASELFERLSTIRRAEGIDSAHSILFAFFDRLHPEVRISDSLAVLQTIEWIYNCFTMMDSGGVFFTNGDADTYSAWFLQYVEGMRPDLIIISLPFLMGPDYREALKNNIRTRRALNLSETDSLPLPPSTDQTQEALIDIILHMIEQPRYPPIYLAPRCGVESRLGEHIVYPGLVYAYQDSIQPKSQILDHLLSKLTKSWQLRYASKGFSKDKRYASRVGVTQYLTLLLHILPEFEKQRRYLDMDTLFTYLEPVLGEEWRFSALRYKYCHSKEKDCRRYLKKLKRYAIRHPDDFQVQAVLKELENQ